MCEVSCFVAGQENWVHAWWIFCDKMLQPCMDPKQNPTRERLIGPINGHSKPNQRIHIFMLFLFGIQGRPGSTTVYISTHNVGLPAGFPGTSSKF